MGNEFSQEVAQRGSDLIDIHQGLLYTVLEFIFTHSISPGSLETFISSKPLQVLIGHSNGHDTACHILCFFALVSYILPAEDFAAAFVDPQPSDWIAEDLEAASKDEPLVPTNSSFRLRDRDRQLLLHMQQENKRLHRKISIHNALSSRDALLSKTERRRWENSRFRDIAVAGAYHVMDGDAKLEAIHKALELLASLVQQADLENGFWKESLPKSVRRFVRLLPKDDVRRKEVFTLSRLVGIFEAERARLLGMKLDRATQPHNAQYLWPRWGNPRQRPARTSHAPLIPPSLSTTETVSNEPRKPNEHVYGAIRGKALWKSGDLKALRVIQETARARALRRKKLATTWSCQTSRDMEDAGNVGIVSAHTAVTARGSRNTRLREKAIATRRAALAAGNDSDGDGDSDETVLESVEAPASLCAAASEDLTDTSDYSLSDEESGFTEIEDAQRLPDEGHRYCADPPWEDFELYPSDHDVSATDPQFEDFPVGQPLLEELDFMKPSYLPVVHEMDAEDDQDALLHWIMDDIEDVDSAEL
ncbi:hypothetical protein MMC17_007050 [Xylographa soralifera]|nr:hypothetical protein [Xylographa soralifera]